MGFQSSSSESSSEEHEKETGEQWGREVLYFPSPYGLDLSSQAIGTGLSGILQADAQTQALFGGNTMTNKDALNEFRRMIGMPGLDPFLDIKDDLERPQALAQGFVNPTWKTQYNPMFEAMDDAYTQMVESTDPNDRQSALDRMQFALEGLRNHVEHDYYTASYANDEGVKARAKEAAYAKALLNPDKPEEFLKWGGLSYEGLPEYDQDADIGPIDDPDAIPGFGPDVNYAKLSRREIDDILDGGTGGYELRYGEPVETDLGQGQRRENQGGGFFGSLFGGLFNGMFGGGQEEGNPGGEDHAATDAALGRGPSPVPTGLFGGLQGAGAYDAEIDYDKYEQFIVEQDLGEQLINSLNQLSRQIDVYKDKPVEAAYTGDEITEQIRSTPGYEFKVNEGQRLLQNAAATRGELYSGRTGTALQDYGQTMADSEYYNRLNTLAGLAGLTMPALSQSAASGQNAATQAGVAYNALGQNALDQNRFWNASPWTSYGYQQRQRDAESESSSSSFGVSL